MSERNTLDRLRDLTDRLQRRLAEAEAIRGRYIKARDANAWPHLRSTKLRFSDDPSDVDRRSR